MYYVNPNGEKTIGFPGKTAGMIDRIYATAAEAYEAKYERYNSKVKEYCDSIHTLEDLLNFPVKHPFGSEEYTDDAAMEAYKIRCKELQNIEIK
jgi:uncharacterized protein YukE